MPSSLPLRSIAAALAVAGACGAAVAAAPVAAAASALPPTPVGTPHDFDFEHGRWRTTLRRLQHPLSGSQTWLDYAGTTFVSPVWGGRANLVELDVAGPAGRLQALSLRLFDPERQRWSLNFANAAGGTLSTPMSGGFAGGRRGVFYSDETFGGRRVLVRFVIEATAADHCRFEQAFSADGGTTWEVNWISEDTRL